MCSPPAHWRPRRQILWRHLLPNIRGPVIVAATLGIAGAIMAEAALSFVGLGAQPPTPSWGAMVADGRDLLRVAPWVSVAPGVAIGLAGISAFYHDSAVALLRDGDIVAAASEERFTRIKGDPAFPARALEWCLRDAGISTRDLAAVAFYEKPLLKFERILETYLGVAPRGFSSFLKAGPLWIKEKLYQDRTLRESLGRLRWSAPLRRAPRIARGECLLRIAVRGGGHPDHRWRRRMGHCDDWRWTGQ